MKKVTYEELLKLHIMEDKEITIIAPDGVGVQLQGLIKDGEEVYFQVFERKGSYLASRVISIEIDGEAYAFSKEPGPKDIRENFSLTDK